MRSWLCKLVSPIFFDAGTPLSTSRCNAWTQETNFNIYLFYQILNGSWICITKASVEKMQHWHEPVKNIKVHRVVPKALLHLNLSISLVLYYEFNALTGWLSMGFRILDNILNNPERGSKKNSTRFLNHNHKLSKFRKYFWLVSQWCPKMAKMPKIHENNIERSIPKL